MLNVGECKFCGHQKPLIKAHVIPESLYPFEIEQNQRQPLLKFDPTTLREGRSPKGEYDRDLVCKDCEAIFAPFDDYAHRLFNRPLDTKEIIATRKTGKFYRFHNVDYAKIKLFSMSVLWRAHHSQRDFFSQINVGQRYSEILRQMIAAKNPGTKQDFLTAIVKFSDPQNLNLVMPNPMKHRIQDIRFYRIYMLGWLLVIKVDRRIGPKSLDELALDPSREQRVLELPFRETQEFRSLLSVMKDFS